MDFYHSFLLGLLIFGLINSGLTKPSTSPADEEYGEQMQSDDDYVYDDEDDNKSGQDKTGNRESNNVSAPPYFDSPEYTATVKVGETAVLDCNVRNLGAANVIMWYNQSTLIFQNKIRMNSDDRLSVDSNNSLKIARVQSNDQSHYKCNVLPNNITMVANLQVQTRPTASIYSSDGRDITGRSITFHQGDQIEVECKGAGRPEPKIKWFSGGERVAQSHGLHISDGTLLIDHADHQHVRVYQCIADNGIAVGHASVTFNVQYSPRVSAHRHIINTIEGDIAELHCTYNSSSAERITWRRGGEIIDADNNNRFVIVNDVKNGNHGKSTLVVKAVTKSDLGDYECDVQNSIGKGQTKMQLVLVPEPPRFVSDDINDDTVITHWIIRSHQPLTEVMMNYQQNGSKNWLTEKPIHHEKSKEHSGVWKIQHKLSLDSGVWHARVKAKNIEGWSSYSEQATVVVHPTHDSFEPDEYEIADDTQKLSANGAARVYQNVFSAVAFITLLLSPIFRRF